MIILVRPFIALLFFGLIAVAADPVPLLNGRDLTGWTNQVGNAPDAGWFIEPGGVIHRSGKSGDLYSVREYGNFTLTWSWKINGNGNSGLKYRVMDYGTRGKLGLEYQMLDDTSHADAKVGPHRQAGALYDLIPPEAAKKTLKPVGEWNESKVVVNHDVLEHWLNGALIISIDVKSEAWKIAHAKSKFKDVPAFGQNAKGRIMLQDHGDEVWFKNIMIMEMTDGK